MRLFTKIRFLFVASVVSSFGGCVLSAAAPPRTYNLTSTEAVRLSLPRGWGETVTNSLIKPIVTVRFSPEKGNDFAVLITFGLPQGKGDLRAEAEEAAGKSIRRSEEGKADIRVLKGKQTRGYYFSLTDKAPKPGEWKYLTQGVFRIGDFVGAFSILSNDPALKVKQRGLEMVRGAILVRRPAQL